jgi:hypothetical protein
MCELKFSCPACGQHISCSKAAGGHVIHCPNCCVELRIPLNGMVGSGEPPELKAELVIHGSNHNGANSANIACADGKELHCRCPVCQSKLRIPASIAVQSADIFPSAELVAKSSETLADTAKPMQSAAAETPMTEREKKIAAERAARSVSLYPKMKPRLNLALRGTSDESKRDSQDKPGIQFDEAA